MVSSTGEWLEDRSKLASALMLCPGIPLATPKSRRSGIFRRSLG